MAHNRKILLLLLIILGALRLLWPMDISMTDDEPFMLEMALNHNSQHTWPVHALNGSRGIAYGPIAIWFYQVCLKVTHSLVAIILFKTILLSVAMGWFVYWLAKRFTFLVPIGGIITMISPYLWRYSRDLWDNILLAPLVGFVFVGALVFSQKPRGWILIAMAIAAALATSIHLMALGVVGMIALHVMVFHWRELLKRWIWVVGAIVVFGLINFPYLWYLKDAYTPFPVHGSFASFWFAIYLARLFTAVAFEYILGNYWFFFSDNIVLKGVFGLMAVLSAGAFLFSLYGLYVAARITIKGWKDRGRQIKDPKYLLASLTVFAFLGHWWICFRSALISHPHYYNPVWIVGLVLVWFGMSELWSKKWAQKLFYAYAASTLTLTIGFAVSIHLHDGNRANRYGPTLRNQIEMARVFSHYYPENPIIPQTYHAQTYAHSYRFLRQFYFGTPDQETLPNVPVIVRYVHPEDPRSATTEVVEAPLK